MNSIDMIGCIRRLVFITITIIGVQSAAAIPLGRTEAAEIKGTVIDWKWRGEINYQEESEGFAFQRVIPSHYMLRLKLDAKRAKLHDTIHWFSRTMPIGPGVDAEELKPDEIILYLPTSRLKEMKVGVLLAIEDYSIFADDFGPDAEYSKVLVNGLEAKPMGPAFEQDEDRKTAPQK